MLGLFGRWASSLVAARRNTSTSIVHTSGSTKKLFPSGIKLLHNGEDPIADIVFVHGLTGDRVETWRANGAVAPWPQTLLPAKITNARILTFGYDAYVADWQGVVSQNRIWNHSMNLLTAVATYRENDNTNDRPIIFVAHSLGGLVCKDALIASRQHPERHLRNVLLCTRSIAFLGTPHHGSDLAWWAEMPAKSIGCLKQTNPLILKVLQKDSEVLARIQDNFHTLVRARNQDGMQPIEIICFYEELPLPGIGSVVPLDSAILPGYTSIGIHRNHMDMTKFESEDDPGFVAVAGELCRWIKEMNQAALQPRLIEQQQDNSAIRGIVEDLKRQEEPMLKRRHDRDGFNGHSKRARLTNRYRRNDFDLDISDGSDDNDDSHGSDDSHDSSGSNNSQDGYNSDDSHDSHGSNDSDGSDVGDESDASASDNDDKGSQSFCFTCGSMPDECSCSADTKSELFCFDCDSFPNECTCCN